MYNKNSLVVLIYSMLISVTLVMSCKSKTTKYQSPPNYDLNKPYVMILPLELEEISGITYYAKDNSLFAESDEKGCLYKIFIDKPKDIRKWKFSHKRDYEDIVQHDSMFYVLNNNGDIVSLNFVHDSLVTHDYSFPEKGKNEFESMYYDDKMQKLVLICKECEVDEKATVSAYTFDPKVALYNASFTINTNDIADGLGPKSKRFKPSAASINPATGELFILSSVNKLLVITSRDGVVKKSFDLDPQLFNQPEGIAFTPDGGMFISNEGGKMLSAKILYYSFKKAENK